MHEALMKNEPIVEFCPVARALNLVGDRWSLLIVRDAFDGICRFKDFQQNLGVARNILSDRLKKLVESEILETRAASDGTAYQEYVLTSKGKSLFTLIVAFRQWGETYLFSGNEPHSVLVEAQTQKPIPLMQVVNEQGNILLPSEAYVKKVI